MIDVGIRAGFSARDESIQLIARVLRDKDHNEGFRLSRHGQNRYRVNVEFQSEGQYLADAERILDSEIVRMAEERIMARIRGESHD
ncbi:hypothetical protein [Luteimonas saliphila]|uniref:hypothetical protein n=1 Tax=Luteimonas saliphila TaxID=2804919 RepID=UPI00192D35B8|nr:hypothetical protein [Luteimonas saliphila]